MGFEILIYYGADFSKGNEKNPSSFLTGSNNNSSFWLEVEALNLGVKGGVLSRQGKSGTIGSILPKALEEAFVEGAIIC